jgi:hypothetical protein
MKMRGGAGSKKGAQRMAAGHSEAEIRRISVRK